MGKVDRTIFFMIDCNYNFPVEVRVCEIKTFDDFLHWLRVFGRFEKREKFDRIVIVTGNIMLKKFSLAKNSVLFARMNELWHHRDYDIVILNRMKDIVKYLS